MIVIFLNIEKIHLGADTDGLVAPILALRPYQHSDGVLSEVVVYVPLCETTGK